MRLRTFFVDARTFNEAADQAESVISTAGFVTVSILSIGRSARYRQRAVYEIVADVRPKEPDEAHA